MYVELMGLEPTTPCMPCRCSSQLSYSPSKDVTLARPLATSDHLRVASLLIYG